MATIRKRGKGWRAEVCVHKRRDARTFDTQTEAVAWAARIETEMRDGKYIDLKAAKKITLADLLHRFQTEVTPTRRTARTAAGEYKKITWFLKQKFVHYPLVTLTKSDVEAFIQERLDNVAVATVVREVALLRSIVNYAIKKWDLSLLRNVFTVVRLPSFNNERDRILSAEEKMRLETALADCENPMIATAFKLAIETGMRKAELVAIEWRDIDIENRTLHIQRVDDLHKTTTVGTKTQKPGDVRTRKIPLSKAAVAILQALTRTSDKVLNGVTYNSLTCAWKRAKARAEIEDVRWHDLRHLAITNLAKKVTGDTLSKLKAFSGHKSVVMLQRYINIQTKDLLADMDR
jgi:integrase